MPTFRYHDGNKVFEPSNQRDYRPDKFLKGAARAKRLVELRQIANDQHNIAHQRGQEMLEAAKLAGDALNEVKAITPRGKWLLWLRDNFEGGKRLAQSYMRISRHWDNPELERARAYGLDPDSIRAVHRIIDGKWRPVHVEEEDEEDCDSEWLSPEDLQDLEDLESDERIAKYEVMVDQVRHTFTRFVKSLSENDIRQLKQLFKNGLCDHLRTMLWAARHYLPPIDERIDNRIWNLLTHGEDEEYANYEPGSWEFNNEPQRIVRLQVARALNR